MRRILIGILVITLLLPLISLNLEAKEVQATFSSKKLDRVERELYDRHTTKPLLVKIKNLEKELYGREMSGSLIERANRIVNFVLFNQPNRPSLTFTISALEWTLRQEIDQGPIKQRLVNLEKLLFGEEKSGSISSRIGDLINASLPQGKIRVSEAKVPTHTLVKIEFLEKLSSENLKSGQQIKYRVVKDLMVKGKLVLPAGSKGEATVTKVKPAKYFGQEGKIKLDFNRIELMDGTKVALNLAKKSREENEKMKLAVGASIIGTAVLGPAGLVTGYFVKGEEEVIKPYQKFFVETGTPAVAYGIPLEAVNEQEADNKE